MQLDGSVAFSTLANVIASLQRGGCVETAASKLSAIIRTNILHSALHESPTITADELASFRRDYSASRPLLTAGFDNITTLPNTLLQSAMSKVVIYSTLDWLRILRELPENLYGALIQHADFTNSDIPLITNIRSHLGEEKAAAYSAAIQSATERLGAYLICKSCFNEQSIFQTENTNNFRSIVRLIEGTQQNKRLSFITKPTRAGEMPFLHWIKSNHGIAGVEAILALLTAPEKIEILKIKNAAELSVYQWEPPTEHRRRLQAAIILQRHHMEPEPSNFSFFCKGLGIAALALAASIAYIATFVAIAVGITLLINPAALTLAVGVGMIVGGATLIVAPQAFHCFFSRRTPTATPLPEPDPLPGLTA